MKKDNNKTKNIIKNMVFLLVGIIIGTGLCFILYNYDDSKMLKANVTSTNNKIDSLYEAYDTLKNDYYRDLDDEKLIEGAIDGMLNATEDEHTMFFNKSEKEQFETNLTGTYYGIGAQVAKVEEDSIVTRIFDNSPAEKAGLKPGDIFISVDGENVKGIELDDLVSRLKSDKNKIATVIVNRDGEEIEIKIEKSIVEIPSISTEMLDDNIGYMYISIFGMNTDDEFDKALNELKEKGMEKLIIDLRDNSGGYLSTVTNMISKFVDKNTVIYQIKDKNKITKYTALNNETLNYKTVILVNENSASASEIMTSALQEQFGATIVGTKTYGKGTVQQTKDLSNGTLIKYTIEEWLTSNGKSIEKEGVTPDVEIELSEEYFNTYEKKDDNQLQKAIELLK